MDSVEDLDRRMKAFARLRRVLPALLLGVALVIAPVPGARAQGAIGRDSAAALAPQAAVSEGAREILAQVRSSVAQIRGFFGSNTAQAFHGSGFAVGPGGLLLTNYHVVAQKIHYPDKYRLEYRTPEGATGAVDVLAIDVRHDLAVVRAAGFSPPPLHLETTVPVKGSRAYAIGFPLDVGLTITEGVSNGQVEDSFDPRIHYSGAINAGMSGGPALNAAGSVIGVNVSGYRFEQLVSFLVPAAHAKGLIARALKAAAQPADLKKDLAAQMRAHSAALLGALDAPMATQVTAGYALPAKLAPFMDCSASADPGAARPVQMNRIQCVAKAGLYVEQGFYSGDLRYAHYVLTTNKLDAWRFARQLSTLSSATGAYGRRKYVGPFTCANRNVKLRGFDASALVCTRGHRKLEGLYDVVVRVTSLNGPQGGFASHLDIYGVDFEAGIRFVRRYMEAMEWRP
jgi:S1-C subfamily serine protease